MTKGKYRGYPETYVLGEEMQLEGEWFCFVCGV